MTRNVKAGLSFLALLATICAACLEQNLIDNPSFDLWCGDQLCRWSTDEGKIARVGTWNKDDYAVSFQQAPTQISQLSKASPEWCLRFDMIADVEPEARLSLKLDFNDDGEFEFEQEVPAVSYKSVQFLVYAPAGYVGVRYILRKEGSGRAVLAQLRAVSDQGCTGERITLQDGAACTVDEGCDSGACVAGKCSGCARTGCEEGSACTKDKQCTRGTCTGGVCNVCGGSGSCAAAESCDFDDQCASASCMQTPTPSLSTDPTAPLVCRENGDCRDGDLCIDGFCSYSRRAVGKVCAECTKDADCNAGSCSFGWCVACQADADCAEGLSCRYKDSIDAVERECRNRPSKVLPRGALCEADSECANGLGCAGTAHEPKRCGVACGTDPKVCGEGVCARPGMFSEVRLFGVPAAWSDPSARIATCYAAAKLGDACEVQEQCNFACCGGRCVDYVDTDECEFGDRSGSKS